MITCRMLKVTHGCGRLSFTIRADKQRPCWRELNQVLKLRYQS